MSLHNTQTISKYPGMCTEEEPLRGAAFSFSKLKSRGADIR